MTYSTIKICMLVLFLHSIQCILGDDSTHNSDYNAAMFKKAMKGFGSDTAAIVNLLVKTSNAQRQEIRKAFKARYGKDLIEELKSELSGDFETAVVGLMLTNQEFYANELHDALTGLGTDENTVAEILGSLNHTEIQDIAAVYQKNYGIKLTDDIVDDTSGSFQKLLLQLCNASRNHNEEFNNKNVTQDSRNLILASFNAVHKNIDKEEETFVSIMTSRSFTELNKIVEEFAKIKKTDIMESIRGHFSSSLEYGLFTIIRRAKSKNDFYAQLLNDAMEGIGTNDRQLIRVIVGRSEIDLDEIKKAYEKNFNSPLIDKVAAETSGDYKNLLIGILSK